MVILIRQFSKKIFVSFAVTAIISSTTFISGCASPSSPHILSAPSIPQQRLENGVYHTILKGQTLWRIAKAYNVDIKDIAEANQLSDIARVETGWSIFIPGAREPIRGELVYEPQESQSGYIWPVSGNIVSYFGLKGDNVTSKGIDIETQEGQAVKAARSGKVVFCDDKVKGLGKTIIIDHGDGYSTLYAHNSANIVKAGDYVKQGQPIAKAGATGRVKSPTLHFQIRKAHKPQNPFYYLP
jgi:murein DD-endopeptidase MepM/ murein hydrolase activator NlpD